MPYYLFLALKQLFPQGRRVSTFAVVSLVVIGLCVMLILGLQSIMNGFGNELRTKLKNTSGDIRVEATPAAGSLIYNGEELVGELAAMPGVEVAQPYAEGVVLMQFDNRPAFPVVRGLDVSDGIEGQVVPINDYLQRGDFADLDDGRVFVGSRLAARLGVGMGDVVDVYTPLMLERLKRDEVLLPLELEVAGIFETDYGPIDDKTILVTLRTMQDLYGLDDALHGIALKVAPGADVETLARGLNEAHLPRGLRAHTWMDTHSEYMQVLALEKVTLTFVLLLAFIVASASISVALYSIVLRKTREIGLLQAMGARPGGVAAIFTIQGFLLGVFGALIGFAMCFAILHFRVPILRFILDITESEAMWVRFYYFLNFPVLYHPGDFVFDFVAAVTISTLAGLIPAILAAARKPAEALRVE